MRGQCDVEAVEREHQPVAARLQERLLACPARQERAWLVCFRQRAQRRHLPRREEALGDPFARELGPHQLDVDTELERRAERVERRRARMGDVERRAVAEEARLAVVAVAEAKRRGVFGDVPAEQRTEEAATDDVTAAVALEPEAARAGKLVVRQKRFERARTSGAWSRDPRQTSTVPGSRVRAGPVTPASSVQPPVCGASRRSPGRPRLRRPSPAARTSSFRA